MIDAQRVPRPMAWMLAVQAPVVVLEAMARGSAWFLAMLLSITLAMVVAVLANRGGRPIAAGFLANIDVAVIAILVFLLLPGDGDLLFACAATILSVLVARNLFGGLGQNLFHPAMLALAVMGLLATASSASLPFSQWTWIACWLGGVLLFVRGAHSWRAPIALLAGALATSLVTNATGTEFGVITDVLANPALLICAFFVASDPVTGCIQPRARLAYGLCAGALAMPFITWQPATGLPLAMLLMNFLAPWLDQVLAAPRRKLIAR